LSISPQVKQLFELLHWKSFHKVSDNTFTALQDILRRATDSTMSSVTDDNDLDLLWSGMSRRQLSLIHTSNVKYRDFTKFKVCKA
jgi:hypothetical protein